MSRVHTDFRAPRGSIFAPDGDACDTLRRMDYSAHSIRLLKPMEELDLDRIFPKQRSKRKNAFRLITDGMTVANWLDNVRRAGLDKVDVSYITQCYAQDQPHRFERKLVDILPPR